MVMPKHKDHLSAQWVSFIKLDMNGFICVKKIILSQTFVRPVENLNFGLD